MLIGSNDPNQVLKLCAKTLWEYALRRRDLTELRGVVALALAGGGAGDTDVGESSVILINVHGRLHGAGRRGEGRGGGNHDPAKTKFETFSAQR